MTQNSEKNNIHVSNDYTCIQKIFLLGVLMRNYLSNSRVYTHFGHSKQWLTYPASFDLSILTEDALYLENLSEHFNVVINVSTG